MGMLDIAPSLKEDGAFVATGGRTEVDCWRRLIPGSHKYPQMV
jgi:hypothetical protein